MQKCLINRTIIIVMQNVQVFTPISQYYAPPSTGPLKNRGEKVDFSRSCHYSEILSGMMHMVQVASSSVLGLLGATFMFSVTACFLSLGSLIVLERCTINSSLPLPTPANRIGTGRRINPVSSWYALKRSQDMKTPFIQIEKVRQAAVFLNLVYDSSDIKISRIFKYPVMKMKWIYFFQ